MSDTEKRLAALETRLRDLEDQIAIYQLMSAYGPLVDSGDAEATAALWVEDGVYDWGGGPKPTEGTPMKDGAAGAAYSQAAIADMVRGPYHQEIIQGGAGHVIGLPHIVIDGDTAIATSYSRLYRRDGENFRIWRVGANRWEFVRTADGWRVKQRINRVLNGDAEARELLRAGIL
jgi:ketosteroid isomerase-like protein